MQQVKLNLRVCWDFPPQTRFDQAQKEALTIISVTTDAAKPMPLVSAVVVLLTGIAQHFEASSSLQAPVHMPLVFKASPSLQLNFCLLPLSSCNLKPALMSVHFWLQQCSESSAAQGLPSHLPSEFRVVSFAQVLDSFVVAPLNFQPLEHDCWQQVPASLAAQEDPLQ
jgi:hypothetical protein